MHQARLRSSFIACQLGKTNQTVTEKRPDEDATIEERPRVLTNCLDLHSIVVKAFSLADGALVVNLTDSVNEGVVETHLTDHHSVLLCFPDLVPHLELDRFCKPFVKRGYRQDSEVVQLHRVTKFRRRFRQHLHECEQVDSHSGLPQSFKNCVRIIQEHVLVPV